MPSELSYKCSLDGSDYESVPSRNDARDIYMRRNPLRFINFEEPPVEYDLADVDYGATFPITIQTWR